MTVSLSFKPYKNDIPDPWLKRKVIRCRRVTAEELERGATVKELQSPFDELSTSQETLMRRALEEEK